MKLCVYGSLERRWADIVVHYAACAEIINQENLSAKSVELILQLCVKSSVGGCANKFQLGLF